MSPYDQAEIDALIACEKEVSDPPKRITKLEGANFRNDCKLIASNGIAGEFGVFMRQNEDFPENFSVGLRYLPKDGRPEITLLRCNGQHGVFNSQGFDPTHPHWEYHIHKATYEALMQGFAAEKFAMATKEFASYHEALEYFLRAVNVRERDRVKHFPESGGYLF